MNIIIRYILRNHIGPFLFGSLTVIFLFLFQFFLKYIENLVGKGLDTWVIAKLIMFNTAWMVVLAVPMGVLFSALMAFGSMSQSLEITVIKAGGSSLLRMMIPLLIAGFIISCGVFWFNDEILPEANHLAKTLMDDVKRKKPTFALEAGQFTTQLEGFTILARQTDTATNNLYGVTIYDNTNKIRQNIASADTGKIEFNSEYTKLILTLYRGEIHQRITGDVNNYRKIDFSVYRVAIPATGFKLETTSGEQTSRGDRELHIRDMEAKQAESRAIVDAARKRTEDKLSRHIDFLLGRSQTDDMPTLSPPPGTKDPKLLAESFDRRINFMKTALSSDMSLAKEQELRIKQYDVEIQKKYSIPFACLVFVLVGCPLGVMTRRGNFGISAGMTLGFYIFYWMCWIAGEKLADRGVLSPFLSMWGSNFVTAAIGIVLTLKVNSESLRINWIMNLWARFRKRK